MTSWNTLLGLLLFVCYVTISRSQEPLQVIYSGLGSKSFTAIENNKYMVLRLVGGKLYIGGKERIYILNPDNITQHTQPTIAWTAPPADKEICTYLPQGSMEICNNFIRMIEQYNATHLLLCGTMAIEPHNKFLKLSDMSLHSSAGLTSAALCSYNMEDEGTSLVARVDQTFSSVAATSRRAGDDVNLVKILPTKKYIQATLGKGKMLDENARFVGSFAYNDTTSGRLEKKLYFVIGEVAREPGASSDGHAARVVQVCANDVGWQGEKKVWTSFQKLWLSCQTNEDPPYTFPIVTDISMNDGVLYGTFTTQSKHFQTSAVCAFKISDIQQAFHTRQVWEIVGTSYTKVEPMVSSVGGPGVCSFPGMGGLTQPSSQDFDWDFVKFIWDHPLVVDPVTPVFPPHTTAPTINSQMLSREKEKFTKIAVHKVIALNGAAYYVVFVGTESGKIIKSFTNHKTPNPETLVLLEINLNAGPISEMIMAETFDEMFVKVGPHVVQVPTSNCASYPQSCPSCNACQMCILSRDPMCAWDKRNNNCVALRNDKSSLVQNLTNGSAEVCGAYKTTTNEMKVPIIGSNVIIGKRTNNPAVVVGWFKDNDGTMTSLKDTPGFQTLSDSRLEIHSFERNNIGTYLCVYSVYDVIVGHDITIYTDDVTIPPIVPPSEPGTTHGGFPSLEGETLPGTFPETTAGISPTPAPTTAGFSPLAAFGIVAIIILVGLAFFLGWWKLFRGKHETKKQDVKERSSHRDDDVIEGIVTNNENNSNDNKLTNRDEESNALLSNRGVLYKDTPSPEQRKVAHVTPVQNAQYKDETINFIDEDPPQDDPREYPRRRTPLRTKSIPKQNVKISFGTGDYRCNSIRQSTKRGTWILELDLPEDLEIVDDITDFSFQPSLPPSSGEHNNPLEGDTDSDSTLRSSAITLKQPDDIISMTSSPTTPRQLGKDPNPQPLLPSSYSRYANHAPNPTHHAPNPTHHAPNPTHHAPNPTHHAPNPTHKEPRLRKSSTRTNKSPTSTTSSSSATSDKFHTAPPSPVRPINPPTPGVT